MIIMGLCVQSPVAQMEYFIQSINGAFDQCIIILFLFRYSQENIQTIKLWTEVIKMHKLIINKQQKKNDPFVKFAQYVVTHVCLFLKQLL